MIKYIGKSLLIEEGEKILVIGDIHIGYDQSSVGKIINRELNDKISKDIKEIFEEAGKIDKVVILGDLKESFSEMTKETREDIVNLIDEIQSRCKEIIFVKGNHDTYIKNILNQKGIHVKDHFIWKKYCFIHGDRDILEIYPKEIKYWIMGHYHPAIKLKDTNKVEKYKCFIKGKFKDKEVIILPSFSGISEGIDVREIDKYIWEFEIDEFEVILIGEGTKTYSFGKVGKLN